MCDKSQKRVIFTELSNKNININKKTRSFEIIKGKEKTRQTASTEENDKTDLILLKDNKNKNDILELRTKDDFLDEFENQEPKLRREHFKSSDKNKEIDREEIQLIKTGKLEMYLIKEQSEELKLGVSNRKVLEFCSQNTTEVIKHKKISKLNSSPINKKR